jgi:hypothetical protein
MTRIPIPPPRGDYRGPMDIVSLRGWHDLTMADALRVFETNLHLAVAAGELDVDADLTAVLAEAEREIAEGREPFIAQMREILGL